MRIDVHCHGYPASLLERLAARYPERMAFDGTRGGPMVGPLSRAWDEVRRIEEMDDHGVDVEILSAPQTYAGGPDAHLPELCALTNDAFARAVTRYPDRFQSFVHLPWHDPAAAARELERRTEDPSFVGALVPSNLGGLYPDDERYEATLAELEARRFPVFLHPVQSSCYRDSLNPATLTLPFDSSLAVVRMISTGVFDRHPNLAVIVSHLGGTLPFLARRIDLAVELPSHFSTPQWTTSSLPSDVMRRLYVDTAQGWSLAALECACALVGTDHVLFGTDHFDPSTRFAARTIEFIDSTDIGPELRTAILFENAKRLFSRVIRPS